MPLANGDILVYDGSQWVNQPAVPTAFSVGTLAPPGAPTLTLVSGGSLAADTAYFYKITALDSSTPAIESRGGAEASVTTTSANKSVTVTWSAVPGAASYRIYRGTASGAQAVYYTSSGTSFTDTGAAGTTGSPPTGRLHVGGVQAGIGLEVDAADAGTLLSSNNVSATGAPQQFVIKHNLGNVEIQNQRGDIGFTVGNVGIGTASPGERLHVVNSGNVRAQIINTSSTADTEASLLVSSTGGTGARAYVPKFRPK